MSTRKCSSEYWMVKSAQGAALAMISVLPRSVYILGKSVNMRRIFNLVKPE